MKIPIGTKVRHKRHHRMGTVTGCYFKEAHNKTYYTVNIHRTATEPGYPGGVWAEDNIMAFDVVNNKQASVLLEKE